MGRTLEQILEDAVRHNAALAKNELALSHGEAWDLAKAEAHVTDVRKLTSTEFAILVLRAEQIRKLKKESKKNVEVDQHCHSARKLG